MADHMHLILHVNPRIRFVFRNEFYLTQIHPHAQQAAEAAEAAGVQKKFWDMHALLY
jgi:protein-disulfide isomerase